VVGVGGGNQMEKERSSSFSSVVVLFVDGF